ncbi:pleckstrin homology domain-containing family G member 4B-like isoform X1 [Anguilla rostrata]|uniref:pleckstrin homology domain-containing family G member 4B-like isoform X1 n=1 Tax=Anguilla rostrata TaxID=7938 RepID=UPI0030CAD11E
MNPESLDSSIQSALSALYPPFDATAPTVLSQLFRVIEERYQGDALQCLLDFLIPAKRILESVQQAACAAYSDVLFRCEGWPLCLRERVVIQLASLNPLLLRPGDFYLQVAPFADQAARIVLKSLLEEHQVEVEETPVSETSYPCIFTEDWLSDVNRDRHGTPLRRCLLSTDQGVVKVPWAQVANPEFVNKPKAMATASPSSVIPDTPPNPPLPLPVGPSPFSLETRIQPAKDGIAVSLCLVEGVRSGSVKVGGAIPAGKPVGWVSPSTWDGRHVRDLEGDYVDLVEFTKEKEARTEAPLPKLQSVIPVRPAPPAPPAPRGDQSPCGRTLGFSEEPCTPCLRRKLGEDVDPEELRCRYRDSYMAALQNPVSFEARSMLAIPEEPPPVSGGGGLGSEIDSKAPGQVLGGYCCHSGHPCQTSPAREGNINPSGRSDVQNFKKAHKNVGKPLSPSPSTVSETSRKCPMTQRQSKRSNSDICPEMIPRIQVVQCVKTTAFGLVSPKLERRKSSKKDVTLPSKAEVLSPLPPVNGQERELQPPPAEKQSGPQIHPPSPRTSGPLPIPSPESGSCLLHLGVVCLPGSRDRTGRAVMEVYGDHRGWRSPLVSKQELCNLLLYLHSIPRKEVRKLGMTVVIDARKISPPETLFKALLMVQVQTPHVVNCVLTLVDKETSPRPERHPGLQMDIVTSMKALHKSVEGQQLTSRLDGTFPYNHSDWLKLYQKLDPFLSDLREASSLLQKAIERLADIGGADTVQEVQQCIREQKALMKKVLEDTRLVALQREGGATLARLRKEETRFPHSEDYRDAMDSVTTLYNHVEEQVHTLVMKSNESLQHLEFLLHLRDLEDRFKRVMGWFAEEGEWQLVEANAALDTLERVEQSRQRFSAFLARTSEQNQQAVALMSEAGKMEGASYPETEAFRSMVRTFKASLAAFSQRAERCRAELENMAGLYRFCEKATQLANECRQYMDHAQPGCYSTKTELCALKRFQERFGEFSAERFKDAKARASACSRGLRVWNVAWLKCQEARQQLEERLQELDRTQKPAVGVAEPRCQVKEDESLSPPSPRAAPSRPADARREAESASEDDGARVTCFNISIRPEGNGTKTAADSGSGIPKLGPKEEEEAGRTSEERDSDAGFGEGDPADGQERSPCHQALGRSLSEGFGASPSQAGPQESSGPLAAGLARPHGLPSCRILKAAQHYQISRHGSFCADDPCHLCDPGAGALQTAASATTAALGHEGVTPVGVANTEQNGTNVLKLRRIAEELTATEREYVRSLGYVAAHYIPELERPDVPQGLRGQRGCIFGNLEKLHSFHRHAFLPELEACAQEPRRVGRCFLRHKEGFALYALYSKNKPQSDILLSQHGHAFFKQKQAELGDKMDLWSYLLKPVQRISKYSLLLQDMARECGPERARERAELLAALQVIRFQLRHGNDLLAMDDIQDCDVNLKEQGQLIRQDEFLVSFRKKKCFRHVFLFQDLILFSKTKKTEVGNDVYIYKQSFKTSDIGMTHNSGSSGLCFEIWFRRRKSQDTYILQAENEELKKAWTNDLERILWEQAAHNREIRMQERVFMGIGNKPFIDIKPSDAAISDRAVNCVLTGGESKVSTSSGVSGTQGALILPRPNSIGSGSSASSSESRSSFSSGRGSLSAIGYLCDQSQTGNGHGVYSATTALEDDDLDNENESFHLLLDSSESSGESVSGFSSSDQICLSAIGGDAEDTSSVSSSRSSGKHYDHQIPPNFRIHASPAPSRLWSFALPTQRAQMNRKRSGKAKETGPAGKSTEV